MVRFEVTNNRDMRGLVEVPELKTGELVDDNRGGLKLVEDIDSGFADVANEISIFIFGI